LSKEAVFLLFSPAATLSVAAAKSKARLARFIDKYQKSKIVDFFWNLLYCFITIPKALMEQSLRSCGKKSFLDSRTRRAGP
jgi:hypothetical protein